MTPFAWPGLSSDCTGLRFFSGEGTLFKGPNKDGKISITWLARNAQWKYEDLDNSNEGICKMFFEDLLALGVINVDKIQWDAEGAQSVKTGV